ncbi:STM4015 family protein [Deinococcus ruber]|uniref:Cytoplasmic protein n=1 Tax=Deinococcus ruber TaxID=1848197 RepID=A0A918F268_9DEIO|nr:STM4015 family protein [Deinococcus ruber]GGQ94143.1 hypothetical protein GCM10008957_02850 [Deinococcus ruber]
MTPIYPEESDYLSFQDTLFGRPVLAFTGDLEGVPDAAYRVRLEYDEDKQHSWATKFKHLLDQPQAAQLRGLVVGSWGETWEEGPEDVIQALIAAADRLPNLEALFIGDIDSQEAEISWIHQGDLSPVLSAFPNLRFFGAQGGTNLNLGMVRLPRLEELKIVAGGLSAEVVQQVAGADAPELRKLELYIGTSDYGGSSSVHDLRPLLEGTAAFPKLVSLGLMNCDYADAVAEALQGAPILEQLDILDLSQGTLTDAGARALIANPALSRLKKLDLHHHYVSDEVLADLRATFPALEIDASDPQEEDGDDDEVYRYVAISE